MGSASRASLVAAASIGAVEALKDQVGFCRWNYGFRSMYQHAKNNINVPCLTRVKHTAAPSTSCVERLRKEQQLEESLRQVMYLSCWGPN